MSESEERPRKRMRPRLIAVLPTLLTLGNAACGFGAITFAAKLGPADLTVPASDSLFASNPSLVAALLVFLAMLFDMLDGSAARLTRQTSELGAQLDSLCDAVSFGVAPAFLMLQFVSREPNTPEAIIAFHPRLLWTIAVLYALCAILRLARFNVETEEDDSHDDFSGLPSPAAAGTVVAFPFAMPTLVELAGVESLSGSVAAWLLPAVKTLLPLVTLAAACLMVSRIRYPHFFNQLFRGRRTKRHVIQLVFSFAVVFWVHELAVPLIFCYFAFGPPLKAIWTDLIGRRLARPAPSVPTES
jgi:CDP-diacylglycerol--serine O-phosphatidyltransferase